MTYDPERPPPEGIPADPLPPDIEEGDSSETDRWDETDTPLEDREPPPGIVDD